MKRAKISSGGQVSVPAELRKRWRSRVVTIEDRGDHAVIRPALEDPIATARGLLRDVPAWAGKTTAELRAEIRAEELEAEESAAAQRRP